MGDPFNCAVDPEDTWAADKKTWCCRVHHRGCPPTAPPLQPIILPAPQPIAPVDPYDCTAGFANWMAGWSVAKKAWCCSNEGKGCPPAARGCAAFPQLALKKPGRCSTGIRAIFRCATSAF